MTSSAKQSVETLRSYLKGVAKKLADDVWGPHGPIWGTTLTDLEDQALAAREILSQEMLQLALERQAAAEPQQPAPRTLQTRAGDVGWHEPQEYCHRCRRSFFPSESISGD